MSVCTGSPRPRSSTRSTTAVGVATASSTRAVTGRQLAVGGENPQQNSTGDDRRQVSLDRPSAQSQRNDRRRQAQDQQGIHHVRADDIADRQGPDPLRAASMPTANSGRLVPMETTVMPTIIGDTPIPCGQLRPARDQRWRRR